MALGLLILLTLALLSHSEGQADCTSGFITLSELTSISEVEQLSIKDGRNKRQWIVPGLSFTCSGNITNWRVAAKWDNMNPLELQVWRLSENNDCDEDPYYIKIGGTFLDPASENPSGVYEVTPSDPIQFQPGDVVGIFQPDKPQVKVKYLDNSGPDSYLLDVGNELTPPSDFCTDDADDENELPLIAVEISSSDGQSQCTQGFVSQDIVEYASAEVERLDKEQHLIPHINFTCSGTITKWTVGAKWENQNDRMYFPDLQIWRKSGENMYTKVRNFTMFADSENPSGVYEYVPDPPLEFEEGDVLGIFQPDKPRLKVYFRENVGSVNYRYGTGSAKTPEDSSISLNGLMTVVALPLVTVEISTVTSTPVRSATPQPSNTPAISTGQAVFTTYVSTSSGMPPAVPASTPVRSATPQPSNTPAISTGQAVFTTYVSTSSGMPPAVVASTPVRSATLQPSDTPAISTGQAVFTTHSEAVTTYVSMLASEPAAPVPTSTAHAPSETPNNIPAVSDHTVPTSASTTTSVETPTVSEDARSSQTSSNATIGIVIGVIGGIIVSTIVVILAIFIFRSRTKKFKLPSRTRPGRTRPGVANPLYAEQGGNVIIMQYMRKTDSMKKGDEEFYAIPEELENGIPLTSVEDIYAEPDAPHPEYETVDFGPGETVNWGIYVPTETIRKKFGLGQDNENVYAELEPTFRDRTEWEQSFFDESEIYWAPASNPSELYSQLAKFRYREILRNQLKITDHLGSGNFGTVSKGVWYSPYGDKEVAVKTLQEGATENDTVKFLQEAAIMGQFHHPNVVTLHGVVTVGQPVMIVMELLTHGDLRTFLITKRPIPGEMVPSNMSQLCLDFCCQITSGMEYLSKKAFVHRDIAARNILVSQERICMISDFGMARDLQDENYYVSNGGQIPVKWTAPEALLFKKYSVASDVWSFGALMYEIWSLGHKPFEGYTNQQAMRIVGEGFRLPPPPGCPRAIYELMMQCWNPEPSSRPSFTYLLQSLSQPETELLGWSEEDMGVHHQAAVLGAPLEAGKDLYPTVQDKYKK